MSASRRIKRQYEKQNKKRIRALVRRQKQIQQRKEEIEYRRAWGLIDELPNQFVYSTQEGATWLTASDIS